MPVDTQKVYQDLCNHVRQTALLVSIESALGWDERTMMPAAGAEYRAEQVTLLAGMIHRHQTDPQLGEWLQQLADSPLATDPQGDAALTVRRLKREFDRKVKLPQRLVEELARTASLGQSVWQEARKQNDFASFQPILEKTFRLKREEAEALGYDECPYDALLDDYEPDERTANLREVLARLRDELVPLVAEIRQSGRTPDASLLARQYPTDRQAALGREVAAQIGFDLEAGRLDPTVHPFCTDLGPRDCRITTRYNPHALGESFFGILHEAGHGIYDQGLPAADYGLPLGQYVSMGIHESQSRMWENMVGRSRPFWEHFFPGLQQRFPEALRDVALADFYAAVNAVRPSLIRVEADEATYNLHILVRFELEQALLADELPVADLPGAWNQRYREYLGIEPPDNAQGVLQDIHWSAGLVGYFPTYALGNLYAAQFFAQARADLGDLDAQFAAGRFDSLSAWLRDKIHRHGQRYTASELVQRITGQPLDHGPLIAHLRNKLAPLYGLH